MKKVDLALLTPKGQYDIATALRGPDSRAVSKALKWPITGRIRYYVTLCEGAAVRSDITYEMDWDEAQDKICHSTDYLNDGSLRHWANHSTIALGHIRRVCFPYDESWTRLDGLRISEIEAMLSLLSLVKKISVDIGCRRPDIDTGALLPAFERVRKTAKAIAEEVKRQSKGVE